MKNTEEEGVDYDLNLAAKYILENISDELNEKLGHSDIVKLLELEEAYIEEEYQKNEKRKPHIAFDLIPIEQADINHYVWTNAVKHNIILSEEEIEEIMYVELDYMEEVGRLGDERMIDN